MSNEIKIVIGSWGSYNECNESALGSAWLTLNDYDDWEEIEEELKKQGFILDGIDEELFVQDVDGIPTDSTNWDYVNPADLFETFKDSGILDDKGKYDTFLAFLEVRSFSELEERVRERGECWDDDITVYRATTGAITAEKCSIAVATGWKNTYRTFSTLKHTADI